MHGRFAYYRRSFVPQDDKNIEVNVKKMGNKDIRLEWVPSAYRDDGKAGEKTEVKSSSVTTALYAGKGIYLNKRLSVKT